MSSRMWKPITITLSAALAMVAGISAQQGQPSHYSVTDLGTLGGTFSWATGINNNGAVSGFSNVLGDMDQHAFFWHDGVMTDLGTFGGLNSGPSFWGRRPNERGEVAGAAQTSTPDPAGEDYCKFINNVGSENPAPFQCLPFVWQDGVMTPLPTLGGNGSAAQVNNRGVVAGQVDVAPDPACTPQTPRPVPVVWEKGVLHLLPLVPGFPYAGPSAINDTGQAAGVMVSDCAGTVNQAVLWEHGTATPLGSLGGTQFGEAAAINNRGEVVGFSSLPGNTVFHAFFWSKANGMNDLGTLPGDVLSFAAGINDQSQIVGTSFDANGNPRAFFEQDGLMTDLNTLVSVDSPLYLLFGFDINARGQIVGAAIQNNTGEIHGFLATPCGSSNEQACQNRAEGNAIAVQAPKVDPEVFRRLLPQRLRRRP